MAALHRTLEHRSLIAAIGANLQQERKQSKQRGHHQPTAVAVLDIGRMDDRVHQQACRIDQDATLFAFDFFPRIIATRIDAGPPFSALFTLWLSITAAVGLGSRPANSRHFI